MHPSIQMHKAHQALRRIFLQNRFLWRKLKLGAQWSFVPCSWHTPPVCRLPQRMFTYPCLYNVRPCELNFSTHIHLAMSIRCSTLLARFLNARPHNLTSTACNNFISYTWRTLSVSKLPQRMFILPCLYNARSCELDFLTPDLITSLPQHVTISFTKVGTLAS